MGLAHLAERKIMELQELHHRVMYLRSMDGQPVGCLAIVVDRANETASYQLSVLNPADRFNRKVARQLALGRLLEVPRTVGVRKNATMHDISRAIMKHLIAVKETPTRAVKAAKFWLTWSNQ